MELHTWLLFSAIALTATITPGPAVLLVSTHTLAYGHSKALYTILGNISGLFTMSLLSVLGLGALVLYSQTAFTILKIVGAVYLIYLGIRLWKNGFQQHNTLNTHQTYHSESVLKLYLQGLIVALSNPKAIVFTTALFPQFIDQEQPLLPQFSLLVFTFMLYSFICLALYSWLSAKTKKSVQCSQAERVISKLFGALFIASGIALGTTS